MKQDIIELDSSQMLDEEIAKLRVAINEAFAEYEAFTGEPYLRFDSHEKFIEFVSDKDNHILAVKRLDRFIAGIYFPTPSIESETFYFGMLWVSPDERHQGIAQALMQRMEDEAKSRGKKGLIIKLFKIPKLIQYYQDLGFDFIDGDRKGPMVKYF